MEEAEKKRKQEEEEAKKVREEKERAARLAAKAEEERLAAEEAAAKEAEEERLVVEAERKRIEAAVAEQLAVEAAVAEQTRIDKEAACLEEERLAARAPSPINEEEVAAEEPSSKRPRFEEEESNQMNQVALYAPPLEDDVDHNINIRTSSLAEPTMKLTGHKGSVYCLAYDPQGEVLCSGSFDSTCLLWKGEFYILCNFS